MKISFDFDNTLEKPEIQKIAKGFIEKGHEVWITSSRKIIGDQTRVIHKDIFDVAIRLGIGSNIQLTNYQDKFNYLSGFDIHLDDDKEQIDLINASNQKCIALHFESAKNIKKLI
ncbi:hypothetical protein [Aquimarina longa]|uniref:hypothetical protein n=1 Tax=Aquimarina longa TaxID=1080221 RepID=UPI000781E3A7|nr:hypothetical protein [Aquimarina longa]